MNIMMKQILFFLLITCVFTPRVNAQDSGVRFEKGVEWKQVVKKAKKAKRLIFLDCYTSWCGPCKMLANKVFPNDTVGAFFNEHFINAKYDMEKDSSGVMLKKRYKIAAFPTLLFIDPKTEEVVHKVVGACDVKLMVEEGEQAINPEENLKGLRKRFAAGDRDVAFLKGYLFTAMYARESEDQARAMQAFLDVVPIRDLADQATWHIVSNAPLNPLSMPVKHMMDSLDYTYQVVGKEKVDECLRWVFYNSAYGIARWTPESGQPFDEEANDSLVKYLLRFDHVSSPARLAYVYTAKCAREGDYKGMLDKMQEAFSYNVFRENDGVTYFHIFMDQLARSTDVAALRRGIDWVDKETLKTTDLMLLSNLMKRRGNLLKAIGEPEAAEKAFELEKKYKEDWGKANARPKH